MQKNIVLLAAAGLLLLPGCTDTIHTIKAENGKATLTDERGGKVVGMWELKEVSSKEEKNTLCREGWKYEGMVNTPNGPDAYLLKRRINPPVAAAPSPFQPMLVTSFGTNTTSDSSWRIGAAETSLDICWLSGPAAPEGPQLSWSSSISPGDWKAQPGWFVYVQSHTNVWAYDGDRQLVLHTEVVSGNNVANGSMYPGNYPCPVPDEVFSRLSERKQKEIRATHQGN